MSSDLGLKLPMEIAYRRRVVLAVELLDAVTLSRVSRGVSVVADGLDGKPVLNASDLFVWVGGDFSQIKQVVVEPGLRPFEREVRLPAQLTRPLTTVELAPRPDYPFATGVTGLRGTLVESRVGPSDEAEPVGGAAIRLSWQDEDDAWQDGRIGTHTDARSGDFVGVLRLLPGEAPAQDALARMTVRVEVKREGFEDRRSEELKVLPGRIAGPPGGAALTLYWNELQSI
jgi:hypothetical protein